MFDNIGGKIKALARGICVFGIMLSFMRGIMLINDKAVTRGLSYIIVGFLFSWLSCFLLYGFGQLIETNENSMNMIKNIGLMMESSANEANEQSALLSDERKHDHAENLVKLKKLYDMGAITEDEYEKTKSSLLRKLAEDS